MKRLFQTGKRSLESGGILALAFYLLHGTVLLGVLLITVHKRPLINLTGLTDPFSLPGIHNQLLSLLSAAFLGYLSMRLARQLSIRTINAFILGMGTQAAYQTFPNNLWFYWKTYPTTWWIFLMATFWTLEINRQADEQSVNSLFGWHITILACMFWVDSLASFFLIIIYGIASLRKHTGQSRWLSFLQTIKSPLGAGGAVLAGKYILIYAGIYPPSENSSELFLQAYCEEGIRGLTLKPFPPQLPSWSILLISGIISSIVILTFVERKKKYYFQQAILISGVAAFLFSKIIFPGTFHAQGIYDTYLAFPLFLALFTLFPAWLESWIGHSGIFVLASIVLAFCTVFVQLRSYAILFPIVSPSFHSTCLNGPYYH